MKKFLSQYLDEAEITQRNQGFNTRFQGFQNLMQKRVTNILLVSSLYDLYLFEEDGRLYELIREEYQQLNLSHSPELFQVSSGREALRQIRRSDRFDLIITTLHIEDMDVVEFARQVKNSRSNLPIVLLAYDNKELNDLLRSMHNNIFDRVFIWQGDFRLLIAIIKNLEDHFNVEHDTASIGVQVIILVEDDVRFYSSYLPMIYTEVFQHSQRLLSEGMNLAHRFLRMRARPKILLCHTYEEADKFFRKYTDCVLGVISDVDFIRRGQADRQAGIKFAKRVRKKYSDIPILLQSNDLSNSERAQKLPVSFLYKESSTLLHELRQFMINQFGFGDFIFRMPDSGHEVGRAHDLKSIVEELKRVPVESVAYHAACNHFSNWLKARTEFWLARRIRPDRIEDYPSHEALRQSLIDDIGEYSVERKRGVLTDFDKNNFDPENSLARIGGGSLGGKARGITFVHALINDFQIDRMFDGIRIFVPPGVILATNVFDHFLDKNDLREFALKSRDDREITDRFLQADKFPANELKSLREFLELVREPLAVRSSSQLEDSQYHPFAGVYATYMLPNNHEEIEVRLMELIGAIKLVYASTFFKATKDYIEVTSYRLEEEKMAVIIQKTIGSVHEDRFYPEFSGVVKSHNYYPVPPQKSVDGIAAIALGLGKKIVDGGTTVKFSPKYPNHLPQFYSPEATLKNSQQDFYALDLSQSKHNDLRNLNDFLKLHPLSVAEADGTLRLIGSTYSHENHVIYDGIARPGVRVVTFSPILKHKMFPLVDILEVLIGMGTRAMGAPVEMEFAVDTCAKSPKIRQFGVLQMRPLVISRELEELNVDDYHADELICQSPNVLGNGMVENIFDIVFVDVSIYDRGKSRLVAEEVATFNSHLISRRAPYLLIGVGRWGSADPWLGIPVTWDQISGAGAIIETSFRDFSVEPSQGSHFFQNITSFQIGYFTVNQYKSVGHIDWEWLLAQKPVAEMTYTKHLRFEQPIRVKINGHQNKGVILKPGIEIRPAL